MKIVDLELADGEHYQYRADEEVDVVREDGGWIVLEGAKAGDVMKYDYIDVYGDGELSEVVAARRFEV